MVRLTRRRRERKSHGNILPKQLSPSLLCLPQELITDIIARLAASSFTDFLTTKLICKDLHSLMKQEEGNIYRGVSLENYPIVAWRNMKKQSQFFDKCFENNNPEALYREGVVNYFGRARLECAIRCLPKAANSGHLGARYAMGIIFILSGRRALKQEGIALLADMKKSIILRKKVKNCRDDLLSVIRMIWKNPSIRKLERPSCCAMQHHKKSGWSGVETEEEEDDEDHLMCEGCASDKEIRLICNAM